MKSQESKRFKPFEASGALKAIMTSHFTELARAKTDNRRKVAWCTSVGPAELLRAMGFLVFFPENHAAMLGAGKRAAEFIPAANREGYSPDICSYLTSDIGAFLMGETPLTRMDGQITSVPLPDVLIYNTNQCRDVKDWFMWYAKKLKVPCHGIESFTSVDTVTGEHIRAVSAQIRGLVPHLSAITGEKLDPERLKEAVDLSRQCSELWKRVLETGAHRPSPLTFFDGTIHMGPAVIARGTRAPVDYYKLLLSELETRIAGNVPAVSAEKTRLYWEGMPIWGKLREMGELFAGLNSAVVASTYCNSWVYTALDPDDPFDSMARAYTELFIVRSDAAKEREILRMAEMYGIHGIVFHDAKTCPSNSNTRYGMPGRLKAASGIPSVTIHGDLNDLRLFSQEQTATKIEAFTEQIEARL